MHHCVVRSTLLCDLVGQQVEHVPAWYGGGEDGIMSKETGNGMDHQTYCFHCLHVYDM